ncbi:hypothetical protein BH09ACT8_BH09ACT8_03500 [soil metagenome]
MAGYAGGVAGLRGVASLPALVRLLLLVMLLGGIVTMHAVTFTLGSDHGSHTPMAQEVQHRAIGGPAEPAATPCEADDCGGQHSGLHECVYILTALAVVTGLALLCWIGSRGAELFAPNLRGDCRRHQRAPPWTVISLHELSILRI